ncbi:MAG: polysaccharide biosynthesis protein [Oligoflexia bacterium]|nr:polysaccharide biosynthesis protein [Oligoflexia bacterium]
MVVLYDGVVAVLAFYVAIVFRYGEFFPVQISGWQFISSFLVVATIQIGTFYFAGLYRGIWRYSSTADLLRLIKGASMAVVFSFFGVFLLNRLSFIPRSVFFIDWPLLILGLGGGRFAYRLIRDQLFILGGQGFLGGQEYAKTVIVGADHVSEKLFRELKETPSFALAHRVMGFIDETNENLGRHIHGVPILGCVDDFPQIIQRVSPSQIIFAMASSNRFKLNKIVDICIGHKIDFKILDRKSSSEVMRLQSSRLRKVDLEDIMGRVEINFADESKMMQKMLAGKRVLVTGAGGSIGSELCRQIATYSPKLLILLDTTEFFLYQLKKEMDEKFPSLPYVGIIGDVRLREKIKHVISSYRPEIVFHAAAYKHVPLMEENPWEAINTNIRGTKIVAELAVEFAIERFVMISSDKAVNPTSVMGASKRVAEMVCQLLHRRGGALTKFSIVRFGNVLGSSGSVIPEFTRQIASGGPLLVTHPEITRYFMSIPEAVRLVMQAGSLGDGGEIFVLNMGTPVKIIDLAKKMIVLSGLRPYEDVDIKFTGIRPGEKLFEELLFDKEKTLATSHPLINRALAVDVREDFESGLELLLSLTPADSAEKVKLLFQSVVLEYVADMAFARARPALAEKGFFIDGNYKE